MTLIVARPLTVAVCLGTLHAEPPATLPSLESLPSLPSLPKSPEPARTIPDLKPDPFPLFLEPGAGLEKPKTGEKAKAATVREPQTLRSKKGVVRAPATAKENAERIRHREAINAALQDPEVQAAWSESRSAETDFAKRAALTRYYQRLGALVRKADPSLTEFSNVRERFMIDRFVQRRVAPTEPIERE